jgi:alpha-L-fucosidase 2
MKNKKCFVLSILMLSLFNVTAQVSITSEADKTSQNEIAFDGNDLSIDQNAFLSQHDIVYLSPAVHGYEGFPVGNGDLGAMAWTPPDKLFFQINKTNTWDDAEDGLFSPWEDSSNPWKAEQFTSLRHCGQLVIEPGLPAFDWMYLSDFEGRLSLSEAEASWHAKGPNGDVQCRSFIARDPSVMIIYYKDDLNEPVDRKVMLGRWGSRVFEHWYRYVRRDFYFGTGNTESGCEGNEAWIEQSTRSLKFAMAAKLVGVNVEAQRMNSHEAGFIINTGKNSAFNIYISVVTSEEADDPLQKARENIKIAANAGREKIFAKHKERWAEFWSKSFIDLPDDYLENLWYINLYQVGSSSLGEYPPHFIGSLWSWNRDARPWNHYYQWNQQAYTWPLHSSGHPELMMPYAKWKLEGLNKAVETAKITHGVNGAFYSDVSDRSGNQGANSSGIRNNIGPTGLTAIDLWRHYEYTLDRKYLEQYAYPVLREVVHFYINKLDTDNKGRYYIPEALPYESNQLCKNTTNDLALIKKLFPAFLQASELLKKDESLRLQVKVAVENLSSYVFATVPKEAIPWGPLKAGDAIIAYGERLETGLPGHPWSTRPYWFPDAPMDFPSSGHAINAQLTPVFPANLVSLDDKGTKFFEALQNAALSFDPVGQNGHGIRAICLARLGLKEYLPDILDRWIDEFQIFSQGLFCYFRRDYIEEFRNGKRNDPYSTSEHKIRGLTNNVKVLPGAKEENVELLRQPFAHMAIEAGSILETIVNEMLLQSHRDKIRVFPAMPDNWTTRFKLHARGGFIVISEYKEGEVKYVAVKSLKGQPCRLHNPWGEEEEVTVKLAGSENIILEGTDLSELVFNTEQGGVYTVERRIKPMSSFNAIAIDGIKNTKPKSKGRAHLGIARQF